jgi:hypothetical protein
MWDLWWTKWYRQVCSEYFGFPCQFSFHRLLHIHLLSFGAGTIDKLVADVPSELSLTPPQQTNKHNFFDVRWSEGTVTHDELETMALEAVVVCFVFPRVHLERPRKTTNSPRISGAAFGFRTSFPVILGLTFFS